MAKWGLPAITVLIVAKREGKEAGEADCFLTWTDVANILKRASTRTGESLYLVGQFIGFLSRQGLSTPEGAFPTYFRIHTLEAKSSGAGYRPAGYHLAIHAREMAEGDTDEDGFDASIEELDAALESDDAEELLWRWFKKYLPRCINAVPRQRRATFLKGVMQAVEEGRL
jgi:hypothetical protein